MVMLTQYSGRVLGQRLRQNSHPGLYGEALSQKSTTKHIHKVTGREQWLLGGTYCLMGKAFYWVRMFWSLVAGTAARQCTLCLMLLKMFTVTYYTGCVFYYNHNKHSTRFLNLTEMKTSKQENLHQNSVLVTSTMTGSIDGIQSSCPATKTRLLTFAETCEKWTPTYQLSSLQLSGHSPVGKLISPSNTVVGFSTGGCQGPSPLTHGWKLDLLHLR